MKVSSVKSYGLNPDRPVTRRVVAELRARIRRGYWKAGEQLPNGAVLADEFEVSEATFKKCIEELQREGLIWGRSGKGRFVADSAASRRSNMIAVVSPSSDLLSHPVMALRLRGLEKVVRDAGLHLKVLVFNRWLAPATQPGRLLTDLLALVDPLRTDGLIHLGGLDEELVTQISHYVPVVDNEHAPATVWYSTVRYDHREAALIAARKLIEAGHRRLGLLTVGAEREIGQMARDGVRMAIHQFADGKDCVSATIVTGGFDPKQARTALVRALAEGEAPTGLIVHSPDLLEGAMDLLVERGFQVPRDMSVVGIALPLDAQRYAETTGLREDYELAGRKLALRLLDMLRKPDRQFEPEILSMDFVTGKTLAAPRALSGPAREGDGHN